MSIHSSILGWEIPWTEEPGGLHGVTESDMMEHTHTHTHTHTHKGRMAAKWKRSDSTQVTSQLPPASVQASLLPECSVVVFF